MKCVLDQTAECCATEVNMDVCYSCIVAGNHTLLESLLKELSGVTIAFGKALRIMHISETFFRSLDRQTEWMRCYRPEYYAKKKVEFEKRAEEHRRAVKELFRKLRNDKPSYRT